jgi:hypothetical protein
MNSIIHNYIGLDGEVHCGHVNRKQDSKLEYLRIGEHYEAKFHVSGKIKIQTISKSEFFKLRGKFLIPPVRIKSEQLT